MRKILMLSLLAGSAALASAASPPGSAEADWAALQAAGLLETKVPEGYDKLTPREGTVLLEHDARLLREQGFAFYESHPTDPRRWLLVERMLDRPSRFITAYGSNYGNDPADVVVDTAAAAAWQARREVLRAALAAAADVPPAVRERVEANAISEMLQPYMGRSGEDNRNVDWTPVVAKLTAFAANFPESDRACSRLKWLMGYFEPANPAGKNAAMWRQFAEGPNRPMAELARQRLPLFEQPVQLQFTAVDGRPVDLEKLRGKVVLVDFWATWCVPCVAELPNLKKVYAAYHDRGFEIVGITLENAKLTPKDTADQAAAKLAKARRFLTDFTAAHGLPWPQYFDGKEWKNDFFVRYMPDRGVPAMLLLNQEGKVVTVDAHGEALEHEVKRLLKL